LLDPRMNGDELEGNAVLGCVWLRPRGRSHVNVVNRDASMSESSDATLGPTIAGESLGDSTLREPGMLARLLGGEAKLVRLRHYVLLERLGEGGMGVVFAAYDEMLERKVALKLLHVTHAEAQRRLVREAQAMARLSHPNVVQIYEIGEVEGVAFIVMEYVEGVTLERWRAEAPRSRSEILAVFLAAGRGLAAAHEQNLVHRDFKPDNVMISRDGRVRVMDFGIAREHGVTVELGREVDGGGELSIDLTATGAMMGTPAYMAPEQFCGGPTDARTDQFSFCVALWEAVHGQRPFVASSLGELSIAVSSGALTTPQASEVPSWLHDVLARGLAVEPERRHASMATLGVGRGAGCDLGCDGDRADGHRRARANAGAVRLRDGR
jgi:serine/threonine protein kinase